MKTIPLLYTYVFTIRTNTHLFRTISIGTPGFTIAIFIHSLPRSTDMTAMLTADTKTHHKLHEDLHRHQCFWLQMYVQM